MFFKDVGEILSKYYMYILRGVHFASCSHGNDHRTYYRYFDWNIQNNAGCKKQVVKVITKDS